MGDYTIRAQFDTPCSSADLKRWLDSAEGIAGWWSDTVAGRAGAQGDRFQVTFPTSPVAFELEVTETSQHAVQWYIAENPPWWKGTTIRFELSEGDDGGTSVLFMHGGFDAEDPIIPVITPAWVHFLDNLVAVAESGEANPAVVN